MENSEQNGTVGQEPVAAREYSLTEMETKHAKHIHANLVMTKAFYADSLARRDQLQRELNALNEQLEGQKQAIDMMNIKASGWADGVALSRGDANPEGFYLDLGDGRARIVRGG